MKTLEAYLTRRKSLIALAFFLLVSLLLYGNTLNGDFVYDDTYIHNRSDLRFKEIFLKLWEQPYVLRNRATGTYRPLSMATFALNYQIFGDRPESFHVVNIILNGIATFLVYILIESLFGNPMLSLTAALIFAVLPIHTEAVTSIKSRDELLSAVFALLSLLTSLRALRMPQNFTRMAALSIFFFLLAVLSKEFSLVFVPFITAAIAKSAYKLSWKKILGYLCLFLPVILFYLAVRFLVLQNSAFGADDAFFAIDPLRGSAWWVRFWTSGKVLFLYMVKILLPLRLSATYSYNHLTLVDNPLSSPEAIAGILLLITLMAILVKGLSKKSPPGLAVFLFFFAYIPVSKLIIVTGDLFAERWMYFPSIGIALGLAYAFTILQKRQRAAALLAIALFLSFYGLRTIQRNRVWISKNALYESMIADAPDSVAGYVNLGLLKLQEGNLAEAKSLAVKGSQIYDKHPPLLNLLAVIAVREKRYQDAEFLLNRSKTIKPNFNQTYIYIGALYYATNRYQEAADIFSEIYRQSPQTVTLEEAVSYAAALTKLSRHQESLSVLEKLTPVQKADPRVRSLISENLKLLENYTVK